MGQEAVILFQDKLGLFQYIGSCSNVLEYSKLSLEHFDSFLPHVFPAGLGTPLAPCQGSVKTALGSHS